MKLDFKLWLVRLDMAILVIVMTVCFCAMCDRAFGVEVSQIKCVEEGRHGLTRWGTCFEHEGLIVTAYHVVAYEGGCFCLDKNGQWIECDTIKIDIRRDLAFLKPRQPLKFKHFDKESGPVIYASVGGAPVKPLYGLGSEYSGFGPGASGSPVVVNGKLVGVATGFREDNPEFVLYAKLGKETK